MPRSASHTVSRALDGVGVEQLFDVVVAEDVLPKVLRRWGPIPGVAGTRGLTGPWDRPGSARTVVLQDGSSAREQIVDWMRPSRYQYRLDRLTGPFGRLVDHATGSWEFFEAGDGAGFRWTYTFVPRAAVGGALLAVGVPLAWSRYMEQCAGLCAELARSMHAARDGRRGD